MMIDQEAAAVYIVRDSVATRARVDEVINDYRGTQLRDNLSKLRIFWVPRDFDADDDKSREVVHNSLKERISQDLLLRVVLGGLTARDVISFLSSGRMGCPIWVLLNVADDHQLDNYTSASKRYGVSVPILKDELVTIELAGMISREQTGLLQVTDRG
ncbi:hypothetical protein, partial [Nocardia vinacea]|uniref:hypothetical protein n=1 Tax=Nocardia vinacea TaxID=96468 RepID=UPI0005950517